jgi:hypothetical protein
MSFANSSVAEWRLPVPESMKGPEMARNNRQLKMAAAVGSLQSQRTSLFYKSRRVSGGMTPPSLSLTKRYAVDSHYRKSVL